MTTRHVSATGDYPFVFPVPDGSKDEIGGIKDLYFVIQGAPSFVLPASSSSSSQGDNIFHADFVRTILFEYSISGPTTIYTFHAIFNDFVYVVTFTVPHAGGIGSVTNDDGGPSKAVLIFDSGQIITTGGGNVFGAIVEPSRTQWHTERVTSLEFFNIQRCNGVEDADMLISVLIPESSTTSSLGPYELQEIRLTNGYNVTVDTIDSQGLVFSGGDGVGLGNAPDFGNTIDCGSVSSTAELLEGITVVNGIIPVGGNIRIEVSRSLGKQTSQGLIQIIVKG